MLALAAVVARCGRASVRRPAVRLSKHEAPRVLKKTQLSRDVLLATRPPLSVFLSPTSAWKDSFRLQMREQRARAACSPFVQRRYDRFVRARPDLPHCGLRVPSMKRTWPSYQLEPQRLPAFSYLQARLLKKHRPLSSARRSSLVRSRQHRQPLDELLRTRVRRRGKYSRSTPRASDERPFVLRRPALEALAASRRAQPKLRKQIAHRVRRSSRLRADPRGSHHDE